MSPEPDLSAPLADSPLRTGNPTMDDQHQQIFRTIRSLLQSLQGPFPMETLGARLKQIESLAFEHFRDEEGLMELSRYPMLAVHRAEHELIVDRCHDGIARFAQPGSKPLGVMLEEFVAMFEYHIQKIDMDFVTYLKEPDR